MNLGQEEISIIKVFQGIGDYFRYFLRKWKLIILVAIVFSVTGLIINKMTPLTYQASTTLMVEGTKDRGGISSYLAIASQMGITNPSPLNEDKVLDLLYSQVIIGNALLQEFSTTPEIPTLVALLESIREASKLLPISSALLWIGRELH